MAGQAMKSGPNGVAPTVSDVTHHATSLAADLLTLAELQARLITFDLRDAGRRSAGSVVGLCGMIALILSSIPVVLLGGADLIAASSSISQGGSRLLVGGVAALLGSVAAWISFRKIRRVAIVFNRSQQEFKENLEFAKSLLKGQTEDSGFDRNSFGRRD